MLESFFLLVLILLFSCTDEDRLVAQAIIFFGAGHETTSSTAAFALHELGVNVEIQERLRKEILDTIEKHGDLTYEAVQDMKYLDMVVAGMYRILFGIIF